MQSQQSAIDVVDSTGARFRRGAVWLALTLCVAASVAEAQTTPENIDASEAGAGALSAGGQPPCDSTEGPCYNPFSVGSPFEGCRTPIMDQGSCAGSAPIATVAMAELAVCMANVRAGYPAPPPDGSLAIRASAQHNMYCGPGSSCAFSSEFGDHINWIIANGITTEECWIWDPFWPGGCTTTCQSNTSASIDDRYYVKNHRDFTTDNDAMTYLETVGPIVTGMDLRDDFMTYGGGVYQYITGDFVRGGHSIMVLGFGTEGGLDYWLCKNSFGSAWGEGGYFKILRGVGNGANMLVDFFRAAEGVVCPTMCGGICGQISHTVCNGRGTCQTDGACMCDAGYSGSLCQTTIVCGNGIVEAGELCDDGSTADGDGCSSTCTVEEGFLCLDEPSVCYPEGSVPTVSEWGLVAMTLLLLSGGTILLLTRRPTTN